MKMKFDSIKNAQTISDVLNKTQDVSKRMAENLQQSAKELSERAKDESYLRKLKKFNPLFPEQYNSESFNLPNMIVIVDDAERKDIDVCQGAIGWLSSDTGMEVLHLYDEAVIESGIKFVPAVTCDAVYYVDNFDRNRFIRTDCIFSKAHEEKIAELKHIAYSLGAKKCSIEISESDTEVEVEKKKFGIGGGLSIKGIKGHSDEKSEQSMSQKDYSERKGKNIINFVGSDDAKRPELKWFKHDDNILNLIEMRCSGNNAVTSEILELEGSASSTMSRKTAYAIDNAMGKLGAKGSNSMEKQATRESSSKLYFSIEF